MWDEDDAFTSLSGFFEDEEFENNSPDTQSSELSNGNSSQSKDSASSSSSGYKRIRKPEPDEKAKQLVGKLLSQDSNRLKFLPKEKKSDKNPAGIWDKFKEATIDGYRVGIFKCDGCTSLFIYKSSTGNTSMNRHVCNGRNSKSVKKTNNSMDSFVLRTIPQEAVREFNRNITIGLSIDLQPLSRVERKGFMHIAQSLINLGAKYGAQRASDVIQHRTTLQRYRLPEISEDLHGGIKKTIEKIHPSRLAFTTDMWTEKYHSQSCLSLSVHFIDDNWVLQKNLLGMEPHDEMKTTVNIRTGCAKILHKYFDDIGVDTILEKSTVVTDGEASIKNVFQNREPCHCHKINLFCEWTFSDKKPIDPEKIKKRAENGKPYHQKRLFNLPRDCPQIDSTIKGVKELVTYFKQSHMNSKLSTTLKQEVPTRFNSLLFVLSSYKNTADEVKALLIDTGRLEMILDVSDSIVASLVEFLNPFNESSEILSGDKYPTINLVALHYYQLKKHIQIKKNDCEEMKILKRQAAHCFEEYCKPTRLNYMSCMLDPR